MAITKIDRQKFQSLLESYCSTLKDTSLDSYNSAYMTESQIKVINFDNFTGFIAKVLHPQETPTSCDALMFCDEAFFLIEFKNGKIEGDEKKSEIKIKILESLLLFLGEFYKTVDYTRENLIFILVYNENKFKERYLEKGKDLENFIGIRRFEKIYFKEVYAYSKNKFNKEIIPKLENSYAN
jgi:hypothetical protein